LELYEKNRDLLHVEPAQSFIPFNFHDEWIYGDLSNLSRLEQSYSVHMYDTYWEGVPYSEILKLNDRYMRSEKNLFTHLFGKYAMPGIKICVYAISKNEEQFVDRFCESAKDADLILIADTGSTDSTVELAKKHGALVPSIHISPWRFDLARNAALALIPKDIDVCVSLDLDEELQPGWREEIERVWQKDSTRLRYKFDWGVGIVFYYEKIHARNGYRWHHPCHEYPVPDRIEEKWAHTDMLLVIHKPDPTKSRGQYLDLLRVSVEEDPQDPRNAFYYARELSFHGMWSESIDACKAYLDLPKANWPNERCYAMRVMARCYAELNDYANALAWARRAVAESPDTREPWCEVAMLAYRSQRWEECYGAATSALKITERELVYTCDPEVWGYQAHDLAAISAWNLGLKEQAIVHAENAVSYAPGDERLVNNLAMIRGK
jgi:glycosyltransferase involved in cell wall biosynthesis